MQATRMYGKIVVLTRDGLDGAVFPLQQKSIVLGRAAECDIRIQLASVSRFHCRLTVNERQQVIATNLSQVNPCLLNGKTLTTQAPIYHCDLLQIHDRYFRFEYPPGSVYLFIPKSPIPQEFTTQMLKELNNQEKEDDNCEAMYQNKTLKKPRKSFSNKSVSCERLANIDTASSFTPVESTSRKRISFAPKTISPEIFDKDLPPAMPVKRGAVPASPVPSKVRKSLLRTPGARSSSQPPLKDINESSTGLMGDNLSPSVSAVKKRKSRSVSPASRSSLREASAGNENEFEELSFSKRRKFITPFRRQRGQRLSDSPLSSPDSTLFVTPDAKSPSPRAAKVVAATKKAKFLTPFTTRKSSPSISEKTEKNSERTETKQATAKLVLKRTMLKKKGNFKRNFVANEDKVDLEKKKRIRLLKKSFQLKRSPRVVSTIVNGKRSSKLRYLSKPVANVKPKTAPVNSASKKYSKPGRPSFEEVRKRANKLSPPSPRSSPAEKTAPSSRHSSIAKASPTSSAVGKTSSPSPRALSVGKASPRSSAVGKISPRSSTIGKKSTSPRTLSAGKTSPRSLSAGKISPRSSSIGKTLSPSPKTSVVTKSRRSSPVGKKSTSPRTLSAGTTSSRSSSIEKTAQMSSSVGETSSLSRRTSTYGMKSPSPRSLSVEKISYRFLSDSNRLTAKLPQSPRSSSIDKASRNPQSISKLPTSSKSPSVNSRSSLSIEKSGDAFKRSKSLKTAKKHLSPKLVGVRHLLRTPKKSGPSPRLSGLREMMRTPEMEIKEEVSSTNGRKGRKGLGELDSEKEVKRNLRVNRSKRGHKVVEVEHSSPVEVTKKKTGGKGSSKAAVGEEITVEVVNSPKTTRNRKKKEPKLPVEEDAEAKVSPVASVTRRATRATRNQRGRKSTEKHSNAASEDKVMDKPSEVVSNQSTGKRGKRLSSKKLNEVVDEEAKTKESAPTSRRRRKSSVQVVETEESSPSRKRRKGNKVTGVAEEKQDVPEIELVSPPKTRAKRATVRKETLPAEVAVTKSRRGKKAEVEIKQVATKASPVKTRGGKKTTAAAEGESSPVTKKSPVGKRKAVGKSGKEPVAGSPPRTRSLRSRNK